MDQDRVSGTMKQAEGALKQAAGKLTGDSKLKTEGTYDKLAGKAQNAVGGMKDAIREDNARSEQRSQQKDFDRR